MKPAEMPVTVNHPALPTIDLASADKEIVAALDSAFSEVGFCICNNAYSDQRIRGKPPLLHPVRFINFLNQ